VARVTLYSRSVFINCPFSPDYQPIFRAILFAVFACGYRPRCAFELSDSAVNRLSKVEAIIQQCGLGIHDISFMKLDSKTRLPRFNMPFELGLFLAARRFGGGRQSRKIALILDRTTYRYRAALSDISGQDVRTHGGRASNAIREVRDWLDSLDQSRQIQADSTSVDAMTSSPGSSRARLRPCGLMLPRLPMLMSAAPWKLG
jgi:hypothetical protein